MKRSLSFISASLLSFGSITCLAQAPTTMWQTSLDSLQQQKNIQGILIHVDAPAKNIHWTSGAGVADLKSKRKLTGNEPLRIASITKSFVATGILRLKEEGKLSLKDPISKYISKEHNAILQEDGYQTDLITIGHLLSHTGGLFDHGSSDEYFMRIFEDPEYHWTRTEQLQGSMMWGDPVGTPGERFSYSDTGYILLGEVIEKLTGKPLGIALRELINYAEIGLDETWFEYTEKAPAHLPDRVHQYLDTTDTYGFHASLDLYGGGGIVTTMHDLTDFYRALFQHEVYKRRSTLETMLAPVVKTSDETPYLDYRMGIWRVEVDGLEAYTHSGFWGVEVWYFPSIDTGVALAATRQEDFAAAKALATEIVSTLH